MFPLLSLVQRYGTALIPNSISNPLIVVVLIEATYIIAEGIGAAKEAYIPALMTTKDNFLLTRQAFQYAQNTFSYSCFSSTLILFF